MSGNGRQERLIALYNLKAEINAILGRKERQCKQGKGKHEWWLSPKMLFTFSQFFSSFSPSSLILCPSSHWSSLLNDKMQAA